MGSPVPDTPFSLRAELSVNYCKSCFLHHSGPLASLISRNVCPEEPQGRTHWSLVSVPRHPGSALRGAAGEGEIHPPSVDTGRTVTHTHTHTPATTNSWSQVLSFLIILLMLRFHLPPKSSYRHRHLIFNRSLGCLCSVRTALTPCIHFHRTAPSLLSRLGRKCPLPPPRRPRPLGPTPFHLRTDSANSGCFSSLFVHLFPSFFLLPQVGKMQISLQLRK